MLGHFQLRGKRWDTTVVSQTDRTTLKMKTFYESESKVHFIYQITDNATVKHQSISLFLQQSFGAMFIWKSKIPFLAKTILVPKYLRLTLYLVHPQGFYVHDGPGMMSDQLNHNSPVIHLTSFRAFVVFFKHVDKKSHNLTFHGKSITHTRIHVTSSDIVPVPQCRSDTSDQERENRSEAENNRNHHCVYSFTSETGFVNLSITRFDYIGYDSAFEQNKCVEGGIAYTHHSGHLTELCNKHTMNTNVPNAKLTSLNIVNERENVFLLVVYSYKFYSQVSLEAAVSSTQCNGIFFIGKSEFLSLVFWFCIWLFSVQFCMASCCHKSL